MPITEAAAAAIADFGFATVPLGRVGAPTPGRIADRLADIEARLAAAHGRWDHAAVGEAIAELGRLRLALDGWDLSQLPE